MKRCRSTQKFLVERLTASSEKWKEINHLYRQSMSRRRNSSQYNQQQTQSFEDKESRNLANNHQTINSVGVKRLNPNHSMGNNEYDDKIVVFGSKPSIDKTKNISISSYLKIRKRQDLNNSAFLNEAQNRPEIIKRTKSISQSHIQQLKENNPSTLKNWKYLNKLKNLNNTCDADCKQVGFTSSTKANLLETYKKLFHEKYKTK